jgi:hypothetical protein
MLIVMAPPGERQARLASPDLGKALKQEEDDRRYREPQQHNAEQPAARHRAGGTLALDLTFPSPLGALDGQPRLLCRARRSPAEIGDDPPTA